ncbi:hybrid sensor histidine kinase/response regulator [Halopiger goleimassiliensis]|uniref:hybrid sensor histidine kinase/response regulator n=1 Tax=Halopiger goleimassiliensis TaxID=1293048 RepID=UPI0006780251|nr:ATP-binding protein [Halopiger goleimassiliensis]
MSDRNDIDPFYDDRSDPVRVLVVDEAERGERLATGLEAETDRIAADTVPTVDAALEAVDRRPIECLVSTVHGPDGTGDELLAAIRDRYPAIPVVLVVPDEERAREAIDSGASDVVVAESVSERCFVLANRITTAADRYRADRRADRQRRRFREVTDAVPDCLWIVDPEWSELSFVSGYERIWDRTAAELTGTPEDFLNAVHPDDRERVRAAMDRLSDGTSVDLEYRIRRDDDLAWVRTRGEPIVDDGSVVRLVVLTRDVTDRKERERTLSALHSAAREIGSADEPAAVYETLIRTADRVLEFDYVAVDIKRDGYLVQEASTLDLKDGGYYERTSLENDDTFAVRSYKRQETILVDDLREFDVTPADPDYRSALTVPIGEFGTFQTGASEVGAFDRDDREFAELLVGHARVKLAQLQDKRVLRERTEQLERQNDRLDEFVRVVSHDLRNPVNVAKGHLSIAREQYDDDSLEATMEALERIETLIEDLLTLAREGEEIDDLEPVDLATLVPECWRYIDTKDAALEVETDRTIAADRNRLRQLLENLIGNAIEHGGSDVTITVGDLPEENGFYVADDGTGFANGEREKVFDPGYSTGVDGTGLGLDIVRRIADAHGWDVRATESDAGGARFEIVGVE